MSVPLKKVRQWRGTDMLKADTNGRVKRQGRKQDEKKAARRQLSCPADAAWMAASD
jgi:hypothetical protein